MNSRNGCFGVWILGAALTLGGIAGCGGDPCEIEPASCADTNWVDPGGDNETGTSDSSSSGMDPPSSGGGTGTSSDCRIQVDGPYINEDGSYVDWNEVPIIANIHYDAAFVVTNLCPESGAWIYVDETFAQNLCEPMYLESFWLHLGPGESAQINSWYCAQAPGHAQLDCEVSGEPEESEVCDQFGRASGCKLPGGKTVSMPSFATSQ